MNGGVPVNVNDIGGAGCGTPAIVHTAPPPEAPETVGSGLIVTVVGSDTTLVHNEGATPIT